MKERKRGRDVCLGESKIKRAVLVLLSFLISPVQPIYRSAASLMYVYGLFQAVSSWRFSTLNVFRQHGCYDYINGWLSPPDPSIINHLYPNLLPIVFLLETSIRHWQSFSCLKYITVITSPRWFGFCVEWVVIIKGHIIHHVWLALPVICILNTFVMCPH